MNLINSQSLYTIIQRLTILGKDKFIEEEEAGSPIMNLRIAWMFPV